MRLGAEQRVPIFNKFRVLAGKPLADRPGAAYNPTVRLAAWLFLLAWRLIAADGKVDPTFLRRHVPDIAPVPSEFTSEGCRFKPIFGDGDPDARQAKGIARFSELALDPGSACRTTVQPREEHIYLVVDGSGALRYGDGQLPVRRFDYVYIPPGTPHALTCSGLAPCRALLMGYRIPQDVPLTIPPEPLRANLEEVPLQVVGGHPPSTRYRLLLGDTKSQRDRIAAGHVVTSLFVMEFAPGGTNQPHHHDREEEIYYLMSGKGEMVAGGGMDGHEGRYPAKAGDAYFIRLNATVGFYASADPGAEKARILAVRSRYPFGSLR